MEADELAAFAEYAQKLTLVAPRLKLLDRDIGYSPLALCLQDCINRHELSGKLLLPDFSAFGNETVAVFSDYSGEASKHYDVYSFMVCAWNCLDLFQKEMLKVRERYGINDREIGYKHFSGAMATMVPDYLSALETYVPGIIFNVVVDKSLGSVFGGDNRTTKTLLVETLRDAGLGNWKPHVAEKLLRVTHIAAFLVALLGHDGHKVMWISDHDAIAATPAHHTNALQLLQRVIGIYGKDRKFEMIGGGLPFAERSTLFLDLLSAADVSAGSLLAYFDGLRAFGEKDFTIKDGATPVMQFLARTGLSLKKMSVMITPNEDGVLSSGVIELTEKIASDAPTFIPIQVKDQSHTIKLLSSTSLSR